MEGFFLFTDDANDAWRCRKHPSAQPRTGGVCSVCLCARLLRLCPDCAGERPRGCSCTSTSSAAASSSLSFSSSLNVPGSAAVGARVGAVGRVSHLVGGEPALHRSRSAASRRPRSRSEEAAGGGGTAPPQTHGGGGGWSWLWAFSRAKKADKGEGKNAAVAAAVPITRLSRSRSVGVVPGAYPPDQGAAYGGGGVGRWKGWSRYLSIPMRSFRRTSKVIQARSPSAVTEENLELHT